MWQWKVRWKMNLHIVNVQMQVYYRCMPITPTLNAMHQTQQSHYMTSHIAKITAAARTTRSGESTRRFAAPVLLLAVLPDCAGCAPEVPVAEPTIEGVAAADFAIAEVTEGDCSIVLVDVGALEGRTMRVGLGWGKGLGVLLCARLLDRSECDGGGELCGGSLEPGLGLGLGYGLLGLELVLVLELDSGVFPSLTCPPLDFAVAFSATQDTTSSLCCKK
jgi:hypothetical protein